jgi:WD40 repeat protein
LSLNIKVGIFLEISDGIGPVVAADWVGPGDRVVSASWDRTIKFWALENGRLVLDLDAGKNRFIGIFLEFSRIV